ncbi:MAG: TonB-dependent receptor [Proteobacteria bacterium]|nr:TonB-dependent receptor [Pseudomonadota bacterium]
MPIVEESEKKDDADQDENIEEIVIVGSRRIQDRSVIESPVAVDFLQMDEIATQTGQLDINQLLQYVAPSFNSNRQSGADGADHIDPATLRGLGPDQTLVLVNGKRRHQSSLINVFGTRGRGNTGTDLNTIPIAAIERIEILRDGASAQYGSDAIAGVINIVLKEDVEKFTSNVNMGFRNAKPPKKYDVVRKDAIDGETVQVNGNYGFKVLDRGFVNLTMDYLYEGRTNRPADPDVFDIYRRQFGDALGTNLSAFMNAEFPLSDYTELYAFGGLNHRLTDAYAWTRHADDDRNVPEIYPNGFDPHITSNITDYSISTGFRTKLSKWNVDADNTFGRNRFHYVIDGTLNASLLEESPTRFDAGGHQFSQNTTGIHVTRWFVDPLGGLNLALGVEHRIDNYQLFAGEEGSYKNYGMIEVVEPVLDGDGEIIDATVTQVDPLGRAAGSQGFPGLQPDNEVDEYRTNIAGYADIELDLIEDVLMIGAAGRAEHYSDFGNTIDGKVASRWTIYDDLDKFMVATRGSVSTGFRAPSLAQIHYNTLYTDFEGGVAVDKLIAKNDSPITRALGIPQLKEEESINASLGFVARYDFLSLTVDGYYVKIRDRIVLTGSFASDDPDIGADLDALNVGAAQFFTNALDTETFGMDLILASLFTFGHKHTLHAALAGNFNKMELTDVKTNNKLAGKEDIYFGARDKSFLLASAPKFKANATLNYKYRFLNFHVRGVYFHEIMLIDWIDEEDTYKPNFTLDVAAGVDINDNVAVLIGAQNILNAYPTQQDTETETGGLWDAVQMGYNGAFYFMKAKFTY